MAEKLTAKQEAFCLAYLETGNASEAYRRAYDAGDMADSVIHVKACELMKNGKVAVRVQQLQDAVAEKTLVTKEWVITRLVENVERAMQAEEVKLPNGEGTGEYRYEGSVANRALELLGKELKMFVDRKEVGKPGEFENMDATQLREHIARETEALGLRYSPPKGERGNGASRGKPN